MNEEIGYATEAPRPTGGLRSAINAGAKSVGTPFDISYVDRNSQENTVVLSSRLTYLIGQVGGCQTSQVEAVIRRVLYEVLSTKS